MNFVSLFPLFDIIRGISPVDGLVAFQENENMRIYEIKYKITEV